MVPQKSAFAGKCKLFALPFLLAASSPLLQAQPIIQSFGPNPVVAGRPSFNLTITGKGFNITSRVIWRFASLGAVELVPTLVSDESLFVSIPDNFVAVPAEIPIAVRNLLGSTFFSSNVVTLSILPGLSILSECPLPNAQVNAPYSLPLSAIGGVAPYQWSLAVGNLPAGMNLAGNGLISGTPTALGVSNFTIRVTDAQQNTLTRVCALEVVPNTGQGPFLIFLDPNEAIAGSGPVIITLIGNGFIQGANVVWNFGTAGEILFGGGFLDTSRLRVSLPPEVLQQPGTFKIGVRQPVITTQVNSVNTLDFRVLPRLQITNSCPLPPGAINQVYTGGFTALGGFEPRAFSLERGSLPQGLTLSSTGQIIGTPTQAGQFFFTALVTDARNNVARQDCSLAVAGTLSVFPTSLSFRALQGRPSVPQTLSVSCPDSNTSCVYAAVVEGGRITLDASARLTPALLRVTPETTFGPFQRVTGTIVVTSDQTSNRTIRVPYTIDFETPPARSLTVDPKEIIRALPRGSATVIPIHAELKNPGLGSFDVGVRSTVPWLRPTAPNLTVSERGSALLEAILDPSALDLGVHRGFLELTGPNTVRLPVKVAINTARESMRIFPEGVVFTAVRGGAAPPSAELRILAGGREGFFVEGRASTISGGSWLTLDPTTNAVRVNEPAPFNLSVNPGSLTPDLYFGDITFTAPSANNSPRAVSVPFRVLAPDATLAPVPLPAGLIFVAIPGFDPARQTLRIFNPFPVPINIQASVNGDTNIFQLAAITDPVIPAGQTRSFDVGVVPRNLAPGIYRASIGFSTSRSREVALADILFIVPRTGGPTASKDARRELAGCTPTRLLPVSTGLPVNFHVPGGLPVPIETRVVDDCGDPLTNGGVLATFSNGNSPVPLTHLGAGRWSGTWQVQQADPSSVNITFSAADINNRLQGSLQLLGNVASSDGTPIISDGGVLSTASFSTGEPLAPGGLIAIFGSRLADGTSTPPSLPLPSTLGATRAVIAGQDVPLFFAGQLPSFAQVNGMLPYTLIPNSVYQLSVRRGTRRSNFADVIIDQLQPSVFSVNQTGSGQGVIVDGANPTRVADIFNPVSRGGVLIIYCEGLGQVDQPVVAGLAVPGSPLARVTAPVSVTIGGQNAQVLFAGLTPFFTGLYQINVTVPENAPTGDVPVVITAGGRSSLPVTVNIR
ncbi:MAG: hypothetical protein FJW20_04300 [Acidimicrobiia bacterium]|nr:hypothetical protein [Acidimicrobiia bacterium]